MLKRVFFSLAFIILFTSTPVIAQIDSDGDGIADDGDNSGIIGDNPCSYWNTVKHFSVALLVLGDHSLP